MELKWLQDFVSLARTGSFSRSAEERHVTQSAFSRRIQALEAWLGVSLVDRSTYPTTLTVEGRRFHETAEEAVRMLLESRTELQASRPSHKTVAVAALHTLALTFFPSWFRQVEVRTGPLGSRLLPDSLHACVQAIAEGGYDFLLTFFHPSAPILLDPDLFPHLVVGSDSLVLAHSPSAGSDETRPLLSYSQASFLGRIATIAQADTGLPPAVVAHVNENAMAEALKFMVLEGHGGAWLPKSLIARELDAGDLVTTGRDIGLEIRLYRNALRRRPAVEAVWTAAQSIVAKTMQNGNNVD